MNFPISRDGDICSFVVVVVRSFVRSFVCLLNFRQKKKVESLIFALLTLEHCAVDVVRLAHRSLSCYYSTKSNAPQKNVGYCWKESSSRSRVILVVFFIMAKDVEVKSSLHDGGLDIKFHSHAYWILYISLW